MNQIGQPSDLDEFEESSLTRDKFFVLAKVKLNITRPATDKVFLLVSTTKMIIVFVHYEKIQRICTFCAGYFHNSADCIIKATKVLTSNLDEGTSSCPNEPKGKWMTVQSAVPWEYVHR